LSQYLDGNDISGLDECGPKKGRAEKFFLVIFGTPDLLLQNDGGRVHAPIHGRGIDQGLKGGTRLPSGLYGPVELALRKISAPHHGPDPACFRLQTKKRGLDFRFLFQGKMPIIGCLPLILDSYKNHVSLLEYLPGIPHFSRIVGHIGIRFPGPCHVGKSEKAFF